MKNSPQTSFPSLRFLFWDKLLVLVLLLFVSACSENKKSINIAVASNFETTLNDIVEKYNSSHEDLTINIISASSGLLTTQIINNAPFDLFLSADNAKPQYLYQKDKHKQERKYKNKPQIYAIGKLALWIPDLNRDDNCLNHLSNYKTLAIANPKIAPYGKLASDILQKNNITIDKVVQTANISQAYLYTKDKLVEAGFVPYSMLETDSVGCVQVFESSYLNQSILLLNEKANKIYHYILSDEIQTFIKHSGYNIANPNH